MFNKYRKGDKLNKRRQPQKGKSVWSFEETKVLNKNTICFIFKHPLCRMKMSKDIIFNTVSDDKVSSEKSWII